jgi:hypothetical protein
MVLNAGGKKVSGRVFSFALFGALAGALSAATVSLAADLLIYFGPGFIFGAVFAPLLVRRKQMPPLRAIAWLACSALAYTIAVMCVLVLIRRLEDLLAMRETSAIALSGLAAGTLGGGLLAVATRLLIADTRWLIPTAVGAVLGLALLLLDEPMSFGTFAFYIIWQGGYAVALALALPSRQ